MNAILSAMPGDGASTIPEVLAASVKSWSNSRQTWVIRGMFHEGFYVLTVSDY